MLRTRLKVVVFCITAACFSAVFFVLCADGAEAHNNSYTTLCAEVDNIDVPIWCATATSYRVTAFNPRYNPTSINESGADWEDCDTEFDASIWMIGAHDGSSAEFRPNGFALGDVYYAPDNPPAGIDEAAMSFPREINNDWMYDQYIRFTAAQAGDSENELIFGAQFTIRLAQISDTLEIRALTRTTSGWTDQGTRVFDSENMTQTWDFPDLTWMRGTDTNVIHLQVVRESDGGASTTNAWAYFDSVEMVQRGFRGGNGGYAPVLYNDTNYIIEAVWEDKWVNYPEEMQVDVIGGDYISTSQYMRIKQRVPGTAGDFREIFVLYQNAYARIKPLAPTNLWDVPYGASVILGPTTNAIRPGAHIDKVTVDPQDLSIDIDYLDGTSAHLELRCDREVHVVDVTDITYDTSSNAITRLRSMWVKDGKSDLDRMDCAGGKFAISEGWTHQPGHWWHFYREVPSYHNTYCPEYRIDIMSPSPALLVREAESNNWTTNAWSVFPRPNAFGGTTLYMSVSGAVARYDITLTNAQPGTHARFRYATLAGGDGIDHRGNTLHVVVDGVRTSSQTFAMPTGGQDEYEWTPSIELGNLVTGTHTLAVVTGPGTNNIELDRFELISAATRPWVNRQLVYRQGENYDWKTNATHAFRGTAINGEAMHLEHTGTDHAALEYDFELDAEYTNIYLRVRYSDDVGPTELRVFVDDVFRAKFPAEETGWWTSYTNAYPLFIGAISSGWHTIRLQSALETWGMDIDEFELYDLTDNRSPQLHVPGPHLLPVGDGTNFTLEVEDPDGTVPAVYDIAIPADATFNSAVFAWTSGASYAGSTVSVCFAADDGRGLTNSVVTNKAMITIPLDWDGDGLGDDWEWNAFTTLTNTPTGDGDDDGSDNAHEYVAGTDPTAASSAFIVDNVTTVDSNHLVTVPTQPGRTYTISFSDALSSTGFAWQGFAHTNAGVWHETSTVATTHTFIDDEGTNTTLAPPPHGFRYYRVEAEVE
jgi:hypothetical protein